MNGVDTVWEAMVTGWRTLARLPTAEQVFTWEQRDSVDCFWWAGRAGSMSHQIFVTEPDGPDVRAALASAAQANECNVVVRGIDTSDFARTVDDLRPTSSGTAPLMLCDLRDHTGPAPQEFPTALVVTRERWDELLNMLAAIYGDPGGLTAFFQGAGATDVIGVYDEDRLIASATVVPAGPTANIWSVAAAQNARGTGAASAAVRGALRHAAERGHSTAALGTTDELASWYERFGFNEVGRERTATISTGSQDASAR